MTVAEAIETLKSLPQNYTFCYTDGDHAFVAEDFLQSDEMRAIIAGGEEQE